MSNVAKLGASLTQPMLDDQKTVMHVTPQNADGTPAAFPTGFKPPIYTVDNPALVTLDPTIDATGQSCAVIGVKKLGGAASGTATVTATYTNADGSKAIGTGVFQMTIDPAELDVAQLGVTIDPPVAQ